MAQPKSYRLNVCAGKRQSFACGRDQATVWEDQCLPCSSVCHRLSSIGCGIGIFGEWLYSTDSDSAGFSLLFRQELRKSGDARQDSESMSVRRVLTGFVLALMLAGAIFLIHLSRLSLFP